MSTARTQQIKLTSILVLVLGLLALKVWFLLISFQKVSESEKWVYHSGEVISELDGALSATKDAETGVRGFLLNGKEEYLEPFRRGTLNADERLGRLKMLTIDNPEQNALAGQIEITVKKRFSVLEELLASARSGLSQQKRDTLLAEGKTQVDYLRGQVDRMKAREKEILAERSEGTDQSKQVFVWVLFLANIAIALVVTFSIVQIGRNQLQSMKEAQGKAAEALAKGLTSQMARILTGEVTVELAGQNVLKFFSTQFGILAGKIYVQEQGKLRLVASLATDDSNSIERKKIGLVESIFGRDGVVQVDQIPEDYWSVSSGLGSRRPRSLVFVPFYFQGEKLGVIEMGSFAPFDAQNLNTITGFAETIGVGMNAALSRGRLRVLLEQTQMQAEELQSQQEELKTSNEELEQQARALESQQQAMSLKNKELEATQNLLEIRAADLQRSTQYKSEFLAKMSHELRTPLNGLLILSTLLVENKEKNLTEQQLKFSKSINSAGNDLLTLINDILDLSKIEARKLAVRAEEFTLEEFFQTTKSIFEPQAQARSLRLMEILPSDLKELVLFTDRQRLDQIIRNFLSNAIKFTDKGTISLIASFNRNSKILEIGVRDTGVGVPKDKQGAIFEAFEQADSSVSRKYGGTGLGLTISRELAALLGGSISLESSEGVGSTFTFRFPIQLPTQGEKGKNVAPISADRAAPDLLESDEFTSSDEISLAAKAALRGVPNDGNTILIVEDDENFRLSVVEAARSYNFTPIEAGDGEVALAILRDHAPSAILLDIKLPGISGLGILEMIKQMPHLRHIPVHMISALDYQQNALRMGALGYLTKPVTMEKVRAALSRIEKIVSSKVRRVLLIEDDERQSFAISELVSGNDIEVVAVSSGKEAVAVLNEDGFDCIILDLSLPDVSGLDLLAELSRLEISLPPIVIYTGKDLTEDEDLYLRKFSESIIIKGARSPERLLDEVNLFLHRVESYLPETTREMLQNLRSQERSFEGKTVLVVDDDIRNVFAMMSALESKGLKVRVARDGIEALEALESNPEIQLVLMDVMMPRMDGFEAMRQIRKNPDQRIKNTPVVALTAKAMKGDHERSIEAGANDYLPKPVNLENLMTILKVWLAPKGFLS